MLAPRPARAERSPEPASTAPTSTAPTSAAPVVLAPGAHIVLTGDMELPREHWHTILETRGFAPRPAVTKRVALVVAADPDSLSGKARKARDYGIPVVGETWLRETFGV